MTEPSAERPLDAPRPAAPPDGVPGRVRLPGGREAALLPEPDGTVPAPVAARLRRAAGRCAELERRAAEAVVREFGEGAPTEAELAEARADLLLDTIEADGDGVVLHLSDTCGAHFPDGYWPAVRFDDAHEVVRVTVEA
ncbi:MULTISPECIES: hypothetical protein [unclassified Streptomyces]|uniref:hypothetical protein n=1 Tax=unclassified Streptomyces TaxID=2593676 RepID=UPI00136C2D85|nr:MULTISPECIES: hypothetical protein [unclassified Streptomyces]MCW5250715.1 hypothetical protein [Streptomyces sp. SHP 1-2]MYU26255.1 hypothetical protein [Streptomyces sp. SID8352]